MPRRKVARGETLFWIPFSQDDASAGNEISEALRELGSRRLLFLRMVNEIAWSLPDGAHGAFLKIFNYPEATGKTILKNNSPVQEQPICVNAKRLERLPTIIRKAGKEKGLTSLDDPKLSVSMASNRLNLV